MKSMKEVNSGQVEAPAPENGASVGDAQPTGKMSFADNVIGTVKVLAIFGLFGLALWAVDLWTSGR
jgi:hypothetical protein